MEMGEEEWKEKNVKYLRPNDLNQRKKRKKREGKRFFFAKFYLHN